MRWFFISLVTLFSFSGELYSTENSPKENSKSLLSDSKKSNKTESAETLAKTGPFDPKEFRVRGIYLNMYATSSYRIKKHIDIFDSTNINSFVIDLKNTRGHLIHHSNIFHKMYPNQTERTYMHTDLKEFVTQLKNKDIYLIGRVVVFKDDLFASEFKNYAIKDQDGKPFVKKDGMQWVDPYYKNYWDYVAEICKEALAAGFDEIQLDYIRFPSTKKDMLFSGQKKENPSQKADLIKEFILYINKKLGSEAKNLSIDVFGMIGNVPDDLQVGHNLEVLSPLVPVLSPMMYPSHYPKYFGGIKVPDSQPFAVVKTSLERTLERSRLMQKAAKIRPWIQGFTASWIKGNIPYTKKQILEQIRALKENGINTYMIWNSKSRYNYLLP